MSKLSFSKILGMLLGVWILSGIGIPISVQAQVRTLPYVEDFESLSSCGTTCGTPCTLTNGWINATDDQLDWTVDQGGTPSGTTGPSVDHNPGTSTGNYLYIEASSPCFGGQDSAHLVSPPISLVGTTAPMVSYWYHLFGQTMGEFHVDLSTNGGSSWIFDIVPVTTGDSGNVWLNRVVDLSAYVGDTIQLRFRGVTGSDFWSDMAVDDVAFFQAIPTDLGASAVALPTAPVTPGMNAVSAIITNYGTTTTITSATVNWTVAGVAGAPFSYTGSLAPGVSSAPIALGMANFPAGNPEVKIWTSLPNGAADPYPVNDTVTVSLLTCNPLVGTFTVGGAAANFPTLGDALTELSLCGMSGPVTLNINPGSYTGGFEIPAIPGASATNTLTIDGGSPSLVSYTWAGGTPAAVFSMNGCDYVTIQNMTIQHTGTSDAYGFRFYNAADHNTVSSCVVRMDPVATFDVVAFLASGTSTSTFTEGNNANYNLIQNNTIIYGDEGIHFEGQSANRNVGNQFVGNVIDSTFDKGIFVDDQDSLDVVGNTIRNMRSTTGGDGIWLTDIMDFTVNGNDVIAPDYGLYLFDGNFDATPTKPGEIINNMIISETDYGMWIDDFEETNIFHNSVVGNPGIRINDFFRCNIVNNIFVSENDFAFESDDNVSGGNPLILDNNIYYTPPTNSSFVDAGVGTANVFTDLASWQAAQATINVSSLEGDPVFNSATDLHLSGALANGNADASVGVAFDIDGDPRPLPPSVLTDIGADEYAPPTDDAGVTALVTPAGSFLPGVGIVEVRVGNLGINILDSVDIAWTANGIAQPTVQYNTPIGVTGSANVSLGNFTFPASNIDFVFWTEDPNGTFDPRTFNDTLRVTLCPGLSGVYTLGGAAADFPDFATLEDTLSRCGVAGPVTINVNPGTYQEFITLNEFVGASATNQLVIDGGSPSLVTVVDDTTGEQNAIFLLDGADWVTITNMTINHRGTNDAWGVRLTNEADHNTISNNNFRMDTVASFDVVAITTSSSPLSPTGAGNDANYLTISGNDIFGGSAGIQIYGDFNFGQNNLNFGNVITGNTMNRTDDFGIYAAYQDSLTVTDNVVRGLRSTGSDGMWLFDIMNYDISGNDVIGDFYGIYLTDGNFDYTPNGRGKVTNNFAIGRNSDGIFLDDVEDTDIWHNTFKSEGGTGSGIYMNDFIGCDVRNNIFYSEQFFAFESLDALGAIDTLDYNLYYTPPSNSNFVDAGPVVYADLASWQAATPIYNVHSQEADPAFLGPDDLHVEGLFANDRGDSTLGITVDIDGDVRPQAPSTRVDIGADEFTPPLDNAGVISMDNPVNPITPGVQPVGVTIQNFGGNDIDSVKIIWEVNGVVQGTINYGTPLPSGATAGTINLGTFNFPSGLTKMRFYTSEPNGVIDSRTNNDTLEAIVCTALSGVYSVGPGGDFASISGAVEACQTCAVDSHTVFQIAPGTYNEGNRIDPIPGASDSSTVTFDGLDPDSVTVTHASRGGLEAVFHLNGADYITLTNMTIENTGTIDVWGVRLSDTADFNVISNNVIDITPLTFDAAGVIANATATSATSEGNNANHTRVLNNTITGGDDGIHFEASFGNPGDDNQFIGNTISGFSQYGIFMDDQDSAVADGNTISDMTSTFGGGIYCTDIMEFHFAGNNIISQDYGIYIFDGNFDRTPVRRGEIINNMIIGTNDDGMYLDDIEFTNIYHNTSLGFGLGSGIRINDYPEVDMRNNIFLSDANFAFESDDAITAQDSLDYNVYWTQTGSDIVDAGPVTYADLVSWQAAAPTLNVHSLEGNPVFVGGIFGNTDLHVLGTLANNVGDSTLGVMVDIDGDMRPLTPSGYDIGADEFNTKEKDALVVELLTPSGLCGDSMTDVSIIIRNLGTDTITSLPITVNITGDANASLSTTYTGALPFTGTDTVSVGTFNTFTGGTYDITAITQLANDEDTQNDTITFTISRFPSSPPNAIVLNKVCKGDSAMLLGIEGVTGKYRWYDSLMNGTLLASTDTFITPVLNDDATYFLGSDAGPSDAFTTTFASNNGQSGNMFDIVSTRTVTIDSFQCNGSGTNQNVVIEVYYKLGTYVGSETNANDWTLLGTTLVDFNGIDVPTNVDVGVPLDIIAGQTYGIYFTTNGTTGGLRYTGTGSTAPASFTDGTITFTTGAGKAYPFGTTFSPRAWNGTLFYSGDPCTEERTPVTVVVDSIPTADFMISDNELTIILMDNSINGDSVYYLYGDGASDTLTTYTYALPGTYTVSQVVVNDCGNDTATQTITVSCAAPVATQITATTTYQSLLVQFNNATASAADSVYFDYGDGTSGTDSVHTYTSAGIFTACFIATSVCGSDTTCIEINIFNVGADPVIGLNHLTVSPNPTSGPVQISLDMERAANVTLEVQNVHGQTILTEEYGRLIGQHEQRLDLTHLSTGMYLMQFNFDGQIVTRKINIEK